MKCEHIGVIGAMDKEIAHLLEKLSSKRTGEHYGYTFTTGRLGTKTVTAVRCGIGKVNAARCTQLLIDRFPVDLIISTGIAGGAGPEVEIADAVVATGLVQHDFDVTAGGYPKGYMCTGISKDKPTVYTPDSALVRALEKAAGDIIGPDKVKPGIVATGDVFVADASLKAEIHSLFHALAVEMESAAIAQTAQGAGVPFTVLRVISDKADGQATDSFARFENETALHSARIIVSFIESLS